MPWLRPGLELVGGEGVGHRDQGVAHRGRRALYRLRPTPYALIAAGAAIYALFTGSLAVARQQNLQTNAFDLGYVSQALWEDAHGHFFQFTTVQGSNAVVEGVDLSRILHPHWLLAFHVEPALLLLAPFYRLWPDPRLLLWLQVAVLAAGSIPAALLARRLIGGNVAPIAFGLAWLLAPGLEGAALSDFHMVALGSSFLMAGLWLWETGRTRWALVCFVLTVLCREDAALAVACVAGVLWWAQCTSRRIPSHVILSEAKNLPRNRQWWPSGKILRRLRLLRMTSKVAPMSQVPVVLAATTAAWSAIAFLLIEPFFSGGASAFAGRYSWLVYSPLSIPGWLASPDVRAYLAVQLLTGGIVCLLAPLQLAAALPLLAINALSSFDWMRSGGGHYSALLAPLLLWAGMYGVRRAKGWFGGRGAAAGSGVALAGALAAQAWIGVSPLRPGFQLPVTDSRAASVAHDLAAMPPDASVSATSAIYPHVSARSEAYWFPSVDGAGWLALDLAGNTHPLSPAGARVQALRWLSRSDVELVTADDGLFVLHRETGGARDGLLANDPAAKTLGGVLSADPHALPASFYAFATAAGQAHPIGPISFGPVELTGYQLRIEPQVGLLGGSATLVTYWRAGEATPQDFRFALATTRDPDGALVGYQEDAAAAPLWLPTSRWQPGQAIRLEMDVGQLHGIQALGVAVETSDGHRLRPSGASTVWDGGTIAQVVRVA